MKKAVLAVLLLLVVCGMAFGADAIDFPVEFKLEYDTSASMTITDKTTEARQIFSTAYKALHGINTGTTYSPVCKYAGLCSIHW